MSLFHSQHYKTLEFSLYYMYFRILHYFYDPLRYNFCSKRATQFDAGTATIPTIPQVADAMTSLPATAAGLQVFDLIKPSPHLPPLSRHLQLDPYVPKKHIHPYKVHIKTMFKFDAHLFLVFPININTQKYIYTYNVISLALSLSPYIYIYLYIHIYI
jgi:hypothetical protein